MKRFILFAASAAVGLLGLGLGAAPVFAGPAMDINSASNTTAAPGSSFAYRLKVSNIGDAPTNEALTVTATLAPGLSLVSVSPFAWDCTNLESLAPGETVGTCIYPEVTDPTTLTGERFSEVFVRVEVDASVPEGAVLTSSFGVSGGGAAPVETVDPIRVSSTPPPFGFDAFDGQTVANAAGDAYTQAAGHPFAVRTALFFNTVQNPNPSKGATWPVEHVKDIFVDLPPGFVGYPTATGEFRCTAAQVANADFTVAKPLCPPGSQVGVARIVSALGLDLGFPEPIFNMEPPPGVPARFAMNVAGTVVAMDGELRSGGDYGLSVNARNLPQGVAISGTELFFWGIPADPIHRPQRGCPGEMIPANGGPTCAAEVPRRAFLRNPTYCAGPLDTTARIDSWVYPGDFVSQGFTSHNPPAFPSPPGDWGAPQGTTGCDKVPFEPTITVRATSPYADSPTGLDVDLSMPQSFDPDTIGQADVKDAHVSLPEGMVVNPAAAAGLVGCSQADVGLDDTRDSRCPDASKIGTVEIVSPQLAEPLEGSIFQARQFDNPGNHLLGFYTVAKGPGLIVKLAAHVDRDPGTGRLTTVFEDNPQLPFDHYRLHFNDGPRAPLINPPTCGTATSRAVFTSWARPEEEVVLTDSFQVTSGPNATPCPNGLAGRPFDPKLSAGIANPLAGATSPFVLKLTREDGEQRLRDLAVSTPPGLSAYLRGVPYCPDSVLAGFARNSQGEPLPGSGAAELASPACPAASRIGTLSTATGAGPIPFHLNDGRVYLASPYKGAPLSLAVVVPAVAGPLDLGNVVVRAAIQVDPTDASLTVVSDPLPQMIEGIPLAVRSLYLAIDRSRFTLAPTSCEPMSVDAALGGSEGAAASPSVHFQVGSCARLGFKPRLSLRLSGKTNRGAHPRFRAVLRMPGGGANIARASVALPRSEFLDQSHIGTVCTRVQYAAGEGGGTGCPPGSVYGYARAFSPLLDQPLEGPVYLRSSNHELPDLLASLDGQIHVDLAGRIDSVDGGIRNTFEVVPDAPVSKFVLTMRGGRKGLLQNSRDVCLGTYRARVRFGAQNGLAKSLRPRLLGDCGGRAGGAAKPGR